MKSFAGLSRWRSRSGSFCSALGREAKNKEESDIDLLVVKKSVPHCRQLAAMRQIYVCLIVPVDVVVLRPGDVEELKEAIGTIIAAALREGIEIYAA